jgi:transcription-repair coupling factor (superfamily II helicase)
LLDDIRGLLAYQSLVSNLSSANHVTSLALPRAARLPVLGALSESLERPILLLTDRADHALTQMDELGFWIPQSTRMLFPEPTPLFYEQAAWGSATRRDRLLCLTVLAAYHLPGANKPQKPPVIVAPLRSVMTRTLPRRDFLIACKVIKVGQQIVPETLLRQWVKIGYQSAEIVVETSQFSRRGGILDIWPPAEPNPIRIEFFGDEIETLRQFDPASQRTVTNLEKLLVTPAREVLIDNEKQVDSGGDEMEEFYLPLFHSAHASILDYLPQNALVMVDDQSLLQSIAGEIEEQSVKLRQESIAEGTLPTDFPVPYMSWSEIQDSLSGHDWLELGYGSEEDVSELGASFVPGPRFGGKLKQVVDYVQGQLDARNKVAIVSRQKQRLEEVWNEYQRGLDVKVRPEFIEGSLSDGWVLSSPGRNGFVLLTDGEIFGWERPQPRQKAQRAATSPEDSYADLKPGDWVVHVEYGIGRFIGLVRRTLEGVERDFLCVEYEGSNQLFVPIYQADRLSRYIGPDESPPTATRLGAPEWTAAKQRVREAVREVARDLLELYAKRQLAVGHAFGPDNAWQRELEASFPYIETEDQVRAIAEVKKDMENPRPMDRLLCGDVGYGKTEVALRAAFKAINDGKQVAMLVPTTVLAQQHFDTFRQRLSPFPVTVEMLSRFRTPREQEEILLKLALGEIDIIIGTHRLIQSDVTFKDLGLVIIDEEQRFGVTHKEFFKKLRTEVDVLTLTATPIPRTLYMALTGVRDISMINTPPAERLPITTHIGPYSPRLVRQAILRELERGGQIFFVHNRVQTIGGMESHLKQLVPEARIGIAHGQMHENELSSVMEQFTHGEIDILLCTSIIESGLDIPNANTLIVDRGDAFGLAQLYQLRGRVGRGAQRAYAYFFRHKRRAPTPEGQERLEVIAENTQLGAGYSIAMRDLEMRGAGDLLGTRQHGLIADVGFYLYTRMLAQAVRELRQVGGIKELPDQTLAFKELRSMVSVDLPVSIGIPVEYVADQDMRLRLYRRIADMQSEAEIDALEEEFIDRFGPLQDEVEGLLFQMRVRVRADLAGLTSIAAEGEQLVLRFPPLPEGVTTRNLPPLSRARAGKNAYWMLANFDDEGWRQNLMDVLSEIVDLRIT